MHFFIYSRVHLGSMRTEDSILKYKEIFTNTSNTSNCLVSTYDAFIVIGYKYQNLLIMMTVGVSKVETHRTCLFYIKLFMITSRKLSNT